MLTDLSLVIRLNFQMLIRSDSNLATRSGSPIRSDSALFHKMAICSGSQSDFRSGFRSAIPMLTDCNSVIRSDSRMPTGSSLLIRSDFRTLTDSSLETRRVTGLDFLIPTDLALFRKMAKHSDSPWTIRSGLNSDFPMPTGSSLETRRVIGSDSRIPTGLA